MSPTGGPTSHGFDASPDKLEALEKTFAGGEADFELEQDYSSGDLAVLVGVERQHGSVAGLTPAEALDAVLATTSVRGRLDKGQILVTGGQVGNGTD